MNKNTSKKLLELKKELYDFLTQIDEETPNALSDSDSELLFALENDPDFELTMEGDDN